MPRLQSKWFTGVPESEKADLEVLIRNSTILLGQLTKVIEAEIQEKEQLSSADYDDVNWALRQADKTGALRVLKNLLKLTKLERDHTHA